MVFLFVFLRLRSFQDLVPFVFWRLKIQLLLTPPFQSPSGIAICTRSLAPCCSNLKNSWTGQRKLSGVYGELVCVESTKNSGIKPFSLPKAQLSEGRKGKERRGRKKRAQDDWYALNWVKRLDKQSIFHHVGLAVGPLPQLSMCVSLSSEQLPAAFLLHPPSCDLNPQSPSFIVQQGLLQPCSQDLQRDAAQMLYTCVFAFKYITLN